MAAWWVSRTQPGVAMHLRLAMSQPAELPHSKRCTQHALGRPSLLDQQLLAALPLVLPLLLCPLQARSHVGGAGLAVLRAPGVG